MTQLEDDLVADRDTSRAIHLDHVTRRFHPGCERQWRLELILARRHQDVGEVDPGGANGDPRLAWCQRCRRKSFETQTLGRAEFAADDGLRHQAALALRRCSASRI